MWLPVSWLYRSKENVCAFRLCLFPLKRMMFLLIWHNTSQLTVNVSGIFCYANLSQHNTYAGVNLGIPTTLHVESWKFKIYIFYPKICMFFIKTNRFCLTFKVIWHKLWRYFWLRQRISRPQWRSNFNYEGLPWVCPL